MNYVENLEHFKEMELKIAKSLLTSPKISELKISSNRFSKFDGSFHSLSYNVDCKFEIKMRSFSMTKYPNHIMEISKYKNFCKLYNKNFFCLYIMCFTEENGIYSSIFYDISNRIKLWGDCPPLTTMKMNACTAYSRYDKIDKSVILLEPDEKIDKILKSFSIN